MSVFATGTHAAVPMPANTRATRKPPIESDAAAAFKKGPVRKTSPVLKIARFKKKMAPEAEEAKLSEVTQILADDFVHRLRPQAVGQRPRRQGLEQAAGCTAVATHGRHILRLGAIARARPSTRSAVISRWISLVPPEIENTQLHR